MWWPITRLPADSLVPQVVQRPCRKLWNLLRSAHHLPCKLTEQMQRKQMSTLPKLGHRSRDLRSGIHLQPRQKKKHGTSLDLASSASCLPGPDWPESATMEGQGLSMRRPGDPVPRVRALALAWSAFLSRGRDRLPEKQEQDQKADPAAPTAGSHWCPPATGGHHSWTPSSSGSAPACLEPHSRPCCLAELSRLLLEVESEQDKGPGWGLFNQTK